MINKCFAKLYYYGKYFRECAAHALGRPAQSPVCVRVCVCEVSSLAFSLSSISVDFVCRFFHSSSFLCFCVLCALFFIFISFVMILSIPALLSAIADTLCSLFLLLCRKHHLESAVCFASVEREWRRNRVATKYGNTTINWNREIGIYASRGRLNAFYKKTYASNYRCIGRIFWGILWSLGFVCFFCFILIAKYAPIKRAHSTFYFCPTESWHSNQSPDSVAGISLITLFMAFFSLDHSLSPRLSINLINVAHVI